ncbi:MAG: hypothetical protein ACPGVD_03565 [Flavobacteriales bacterium]
MKRVIVDYIKIPEDILQKLVEKYPNGYNNRDIITFVNAKGKSVEAVELRTGDTCYLVKVSQNLEDIMDDYDSDDEETDLDDDFVDDLDEDIEELPDDD